MSLRRCRTITVAVALAAALPAFGRAVTAVADDPPILEYSSSGGRPAAAEFNRVMPRRAVQALLPDIARAPRDRADVDAGLQGTDVTAEHLEASA